MHKIPAVVASTMVVLRTHSALAAGDDPWLSRDKAFHFDVSAGVAAVGYAASAAWIVDARWKALAVGGGLALGLGAGKELLDLAGLGDPSWKDLAWDGLGTVAGLSLAWAIDLSIGGINRAHPALASPRASGSFTVVRF